jgi:nucleoside-diphosphate-sugar epimerase
MRSRRNAPRGARCGSGVPTLAFEHDSILAADAGPVGGVAGVKVLLTGATGFIGSHLARALVRRGHEVRAAVREGADTRRIADLLPSLERVTCDLWRASPAELETLCRGAELALHAAWYAVPGQYLPARENLDCVSGSLRLLEACAAAGVSRLVGVGSCFEYEFTDHALSEASPVGPGTLYAASKVAVRYLGEQRAALLGLSFAWARIFYLYGPFEDERRLVPAVIHALLRGQPVDITSGKGVRDFLHVGDVASGLLTIAESTLTGVVNVGSGEPVTIRQVVETLESLTGRPGLARFGARPDNPTDPS